MNYFIKLLFNPYGKISRMEMLLGLVGIFVFCMVSCLAIQFVVMQFIPGFNFIPFSKGYDTLVMIILFPILCIKRLRDAGYSPWFTIVAVIPFMPIILIGVLMFFKGKK